MKKSVKRRHGCDVVIDIGGDGRYSTCVRHGFLRFFLLLTLAALFAGCGRGRAGAPVGAAPVQPLHLTLRPNEVAVGAEHSCVIDPHGHVVCWGQNSMGQLGAPRGREANCHGEDYQEEIEFPGRCSGPAPVPGVDQAREIALGGEHSCALRADGSVLCWGSHWQGELGVGLAPDGCGREPTPCAKTPVLVPGVRARSIAAGGSTTCALTSDAHVACWGSGEFGQMGTLDDLEKCTVSTIRCSRTPRVIGGIDSVVQLAVGVWHVCALRDDGGVWCWGAHALGQLGIGDARTLDCGGYACVPKPTRVPGVIAKQVAAGAFHTCALVQDGGVACWGRDDVGNIGGPAAAGKCKMGPNDIPCERSARRIPVFWGVARIATGATCAILERGELSCWGGDVMHQLGLGVPGPDRCQPNGEREKVFGQACSRAPLRVAGAGVVRSVASGAHACAIRSDGAVECWGSDGAGEAGPPETPQLLCEFLPDQKGPCVAAPRVLSLILPHFGE